MPPTNPAEPVELTPAEEAAARRREADEQAGLPYKWTQTISDLDITIPLPISTLKARDLTVVITKTALKIVVKGQDPIIDDKFPHPILVDESTWTLETTATGKEISVHLDKSNKMEWWAQVVVGAPKIDTTKIQPENSKLSDLDGETRGMVEKMMWDQRQKEIGEKTSEEVKKEEMLAKFMKEHPEMDFSGAKIS